MLRILLATFCAIGVWSTEIPSAQSPKDRPEGACSPKNNTCLNGGNCTKVEGNDFQCSCLFYYYGPICQYGDHDGIFETCVERLTRPDCESCAQKIFPGCLTQCNKPIIPHCAKCVKNVLGQSEDCSDCVDPVYEAISLCANVPPLPTPSVSTSSTKFTTSPNATSTTATVSTSSAKVQSTTATKVQSTTTTKRSSAVVYRGFGWIGITLLTCQVAVQFLWS